MMTQATLTNLTETVMAVLQRRGPVVVPGARDQLDLLIRLKRDLIAFVTLDSAPRERYLHASRAFEALYTSRIGEWIELDPAMVLVRADANPRWDEFYNQIQIDPYFCRKFVVSIPEGSDLGSEIKHLPFAPIEMPEIAGHPRPVDARSLLMAGGLTAKMAERLVKPHAPGRSTLVDTLLGEGLPNWAPSPSIREKLRELKWRHVGNRRLRSLQVRWFRAYRQQSFDLDADIVVLYGPNGFGKTSFFDAVDFLLTGGVGRLEERLGRHRSTAGRPLTHLDAAGDRALVQGEVVFDGERMELTRNSANSWQLKIGSTECNTKEGLLKILDLPKSAIEPRVQRLVDLFRSTHIFGQEYQALTRDLGTKSVLDAGVVSRMLALQDYVEALHTLEAAKADIQRRVSPIEAEVRDFELLAESKRAVIKDMEHRAKTPETPEKLLQTGRELATRARNHVQAVIELPQAVNPALARMWRGALEGELRSATDRKNAVQELAAKLVSLESKRAELSKLV